MQKPIYDYIKSIGIATLLLVMLSACAKKINFPSSAMVPAANGYVKIKSTDNNYTIEVRLENLAPAKNLSPPRETYVVWAETKDQGIKKLGVMNSSSGMFSSTLKSSLSATLAVKPTKIFVTAEDRHDVQFPGMPVVLQTESFKVR
jgi:hypothetical protein